jgi:hypothetical protein
MNRVLLLIGTLCVLGFSASSRAEEKTWDGECGTRRWDCGNNWDPNGAPGASDSVVVEEQDGLIEIRLAAQATQVNVASSMSIETSQVVSFSGRSTLNNATVGTFSSPRLTAGDVIEFTGQCRIGGQLLGSGSFLITGSATSPSATVMTLLANTGSLTVETTRTINLFDPGRLNNTGTLVLAGTGQIAGSQTTTQVSSSGTLRKTDGGLSVIGPRFTMTGGSLEVVAGTLRLTGPVELLGGSASVDLGALLEFSGAAVAREINGLGEFSGQGRVRIGVPVRVRTAVTTNMQVGGFVLGADLEIDGGVTLTNNGLFDLSTGDCRGLGSIENNGTILISSLADVEPDLRNRHFVIQSNSVNFGPGALTNEGTWQSTAGVIGSTHGVAFDNNKGTMDFQGGLTKIIRAPLLMRGSAKIKVAEGLVNIAGGSNWSGLSVVELRNGSVESSAEPLRFAEGGAIVLLGSGRFTIESMVEGDGRIGSFLVDESAQKGLVISAEVVNDVQFNNLGHMTLEFATLHESIVDNKGLLTLRGGNFAPRAIIESDFTRQTEGLDLSPLGTVENRGHYLLEGPGSIRGPSGAFFENRLKLEKTNTGEFIIDCPFDNEGVVEANQGVLRFVNAEEKVAQIENGRLIGGGWNAVSPGRILFDVALHSIETTLVGNEDSMPGLKDVRSISGDVLLNGPLTLGHNDPLMLPGNGKIRLATPGGKLLAPGGIDGDATSQLHGIVVLNLNGGCGPPFDLGFFAPSITTDGSLLPGGPGAIGALPVTGTYLPSEQARLEIELGDAGPCAAHDQLLVDGDVTLDGVLRVGVIGAYQPAPGDRFDVVRVFDGNLSGRFDAVVGPGAYHVEYTGETATLVADTIPGDADGDGDLDLDDHRAFFTCMTGPGGGVNQGCRPFDFTSDEDVDLADWTAFQLRFSGPS